MHLEAAGRKWTCTVLAVLGNIRVIRTCFFCCSISAFFHTDAPNFAAVHLLYTLTLQMTRWADYVGATTDVLQLCLDRLSKADLSLLQVSDVNCILDLPEAVRSLPSFGKVTGTCLRWLSFSFSEPAVRTDELLSRFTCLSLAAVKLFAQKASASESRVQLLASWFVADGKKGGADDPELLCHLLVSDLNCWLSANTCDEVLLGICSKWLLHQYHDEHKVIVVDVCLQSFKGLELPAVKVWAGLDDLAVYNENNVAVLLTLWCDGKTFAEVEKRELSSLLRLKQLSCSFLTFQLPKLGWFSALDMSPSLLSLSLMVDKGLEDLGEDFPAAWVAPARRGGLIDDANERCMIKHGFSKSRTMGLVFKATVSGNVSNIYSPISYYGGFY